MADQDDGPTHAWRDPDLHAGHHHGEHYSHHTHAHNSEAIGPSPSSNWTPRSNSNNHQFIKPSPSSDWTSGNNARYQDEDEDEEDEEEDEGDAQGAADGSTTPPKDFTLRSTIVGLAIGALICFTNTFFGLQSGWM